MTKIAIHQSQYLPWPPYFRKIALSEVFVVMDNVQYQKNGVQNRNKIRNKANDFWLTIPVTGTLSDTIREKRFASNTWKEKHWNSIRASYSRAPMWSLYCEGLEALYNEEYRNLAEVNYNFLLFFLNKLQIKTKIVLLSDLKVEGKKSDLVLSICKALHATSYISGTGAQNYLREDDFESVGINVEYVPSSPPVYQQFNGDFIAGLSLLDMIMNCDQDYVVNYLLDKKGSC